MSFKEFLAEFQSSGFKGTAYHGSGTRFDKFDQKKARIVNDFYGGGVAYFTDNLKVAITYAKSMSKNSGTGTPLVYTCKLNLKKVFDVDHEFTGRDLKKILPDDVEGFARGAGLLKRGSDKYSVIANVSSGNVSISGDQVFKGLSSGMNQTAKARKHLESLGYDGLRYNGGVNMAMATKHNVYLAYDAKDIDVLKRQIVRKK